MKYWVVCIPLFFAFSNASSSLMAANLSNTQDFSIPTIDLFPTILTVSDLEVDEKWRISDFSNLSLYHFESEPLTDDFLTSIEVGYSHIDNDAQLGNETYKPIEVDLSENFHPLTSGLPTDYLHYDLEQIDFKLARNYSESADFFNFRTKLGARYLSFEHTMAAGNKDNGYQGVGPLVGVNSRYKLNSQVGLVGNAEYAAILSNTAGVTDFNNFNAQHLDKFMTNFIGRVGIDYKYAFKGDVTAKVEAGYQVNHYLSGTDVLHGNFSANQKIFGLESNILSFNGPYLTFSFHA